MKLNRRTETRQQNSQSLVLPKIFQRNIDKRINNETLRCGKNEVYTCRVSMEIQQAALHHKFC
jgi:hypothetical protein